MNFLIDYKRLVNKKYRMVVFLGLLLFVSQTFAAGHNTLQNLEKSELTMTTSDKQLLKAFKWAKQQALAYVNPNDPVGPWYEAALPGRSAFCMRDVAHQALGAHVLGLQRYNMNMLLKFAEGISDSRDWCSYWEINKDDKPAPIDYINDEAFHYNLPANFDVLDCCWRMYNWTGDERYINDPVLLEFYERTTTDYVERWQLGSDEAMIRERYINLKIDDPYKMLSLVVGNKISEKERLQVTRGPPSYEEGVRGLVRLGVDLLALQQAAFDDYARILQIKGKHQAAKKFQNKGESIRKLIDQYFWNEREQQFYSLLLINGQFLFTGAAQRFLLYSNALRDVDKIHSLVQQMEHFHDIDCDPLNVESLSYFPGIYYRYGYPQKAYQLIEKLSSPETPRRDYPEVSYAVLGSMISGMMGIEPNAQQHRIKTLPQLKDETKWIEFEKLPVMGNTLNVKHNGNIKTTLTHESGKEFEWRAKFYGEFNKIKVDNQTVDAHKDEDLMGRPFVSAVIKVKPGETHTASVEFEKL